MIRCGALHLDDRAGLALQQPEIGEEVVLAGRLELLQRARGCAPSRRDRWQWASIRSRAVSVEVSPSPRAAICASSSSFRSGCMVTSPSGSPRSSRAQAVPQPAQNPFFKHGEAELFLARRDGRVVGRISAQIDRDFNEYQDNDWGMFGFFEWRTTTRRAGAARRRRGLAARARPRPDGRPDGLHDERRGGVLIDGFEREPMVRQPGTRPTTSGCSRGPA